MTYAECCRFYHRAIPFEIQGHKGILTARALKPLRCHYLYFCTSKASNPSSKLCYAAFSKPLKDSDCGARRSECQQSAVYLLYE